MPITHSDKRVVRIVVTGPESTGKSSLTRYLAQRFRVPYALEYARAYLEANGPGYDYAQLQRMAREHLAYQADHVPPHAPLGLFDTDLTNYRIWSEELFGACSPELIQTEEAEIHHRYLLCAPDLPWEPDPLREAPDTLRREQLFERHRLELERLKRPYITIRGAGPTRQQNAEAAFRQLTMMG
jgi:nicotinamide riboside kinase